MDIVSLDMMHVCLSSICCNRFNRFNRFDLMDRLDRWEKLTGDPARHMCSTWVATRTGRLHGNLHWALRWGLWRAPVPTKPWRPRWLQPQKWYRHGTAMVSHGKPFLSFQSLWIMMHHDAGLDQIPRLSSHSCRLTSKLCFEACSACYKEFVSLVLRGAQAQ